jgi:hypothetical protein
LWELIDQELGVEGRPRPNWTISSGSRSLKFLEFPTQKVQWDRLRGRYKQLAPYDKKTVRKASEIDLIEMISEIDQKCKQWGTHVLYCSSLWFDELQRQRANPEISIPAMQLFSYFQSTSWSALARVRYNDDQLFQQKLFLSINALLLRRNFFV